MNVRCAALLMGLAVVAVTPGTAGAADLYGGSIKDSYAPMASAGPSTYLRIDGGYGVHDDPVMVEGGIYDLTDTQIDGAWTLGGGIGRYFTDTIRADVTYDHRFEADAEGTLSDPYATLSGTRKFGLESDVVLVNAYYDFNRTGRFNPYLGLGLGVVHHQTTEGTVTDPCGCTGTVQEGSSTHVAGALMAGFVTKLRGGEQTVSGGIKDAPVVVDSGRALYLDVGYRFLYLGETATGAVTLNNNGGTVVSRDPTVEDIHAHEFRVGLRYDLR
ncbi:MAG: porin family protein [Hyphomicrobium sp.]